MLFQGAFSALVTPFTDSNEVDYTEYRRLIQFQMANGISGLVPCGTTGESPTLNSVEKEKLIQIALEEAAGKIPVIAGTGNYNTAETIVATAAAAAAGASAALIITPYYNKPTQEGLFLHFKAVADANPTIDIVIYNVPSRTNVNILPVTVERLALACKNITTIKEASGDVGQILDIHRRLGDRLTILSGEDTLVWPYIAAGAKGVISVMSNIVPAEFVQLVELGLAGKNREALALQNKLNPLVQFLFTETNPIPVKYVLQKMGFKTGNYRLPLHPFSASYHEQMNTLLKEQGLI
jgi:4-hydroxy-tetrahydrodipicolinate synthase